jgi:hypothetical protein
MILNPLYLNKLHLTRVWRNGGLSVKLKVLAF